jgi:probable F420-dependent oxidoreductase
MPHPRRFRFACELHDPLPGLNWLDSFREVEQLGYSTLFLPDHLHEGPGPLAAMAAAASVTSELIVGPLVFDCDFRHPAMLARELATIDQLAEGRLEVGLGAGWRRLDYDQAGIPMDRPGIRVSRMIEHAAVLRGLWSDGEFSFAGEHYVIRELDGSPAPYTAGGPPILIGGGAPRVLRFAGATADIVGVNASIHSGEIGTEAARDGQADRIDQKVEWVREGAGDRFDELELNTWLALASVTDDAQALAEAVAPGFDGTPDEVLESPLTLIGTPGEIADRLHARRERWGYSYHVLPGDRAHEFAPVVASLTGR